MGDPGGVNYPLFCANICVWDKHIPPGSIPQPTTLRFALNYTWEQGREPLHWDIDPTKTNGVGPGMAFADHLLAKASENVGTEKWTINSRMIGYIFGSICLNSKWSFFILLRMIIYI